MAEHVDIHVVHPGGKLQCRSYLIVAGPGAVLVDPGSGVCEEELLANVRRLGIAPERISHVLLTHCHVDHALGAHRFRERGARLVAAARTAEILAAGGHQVWYEHAECVVPTPVDVVLGAGRALDLGGVAVTFLPTPGHTAGCATYFVRSGGRLVAFTGDLVMGNAQPGWAGSDDFSAEATIRSLEALLAAGPDRVLTGHGAVEEGVRQWLETAIALGRAGQWNLTVRPGAVEVPPGLRPPKGDPPPVVGGGPR